MKHTLSALVAALAAIFVSGCAAPSYQRVATPDLTVEAPPSARARIYFVREPALIGAVRGVRIAENGSEIGRIGRDRFLCWEREPGRSLVTLDYDGLVFEPDEQSVIDVDCAAGEVQYYGITIDPARNKPIVCPLPSHAAHEILSEQAPAPIG